MNSLPVECHELILQHLSDDHQTLARVLTLNRAWLMLALPVLFADPFATCPPKHHASLCRLLLRSILTLDPCPVHPQVCRHVLCLLQPVSAVASAASASASVSAASTSAASVSAASTSAASAPVASTSAASAPPPPPAATVAWPRLAPTFAPYASYMTLFKSLPWDNFVNQTYGRTMSAKALHRLRCKVFRAVLGGSQARQRSIQLPVDRLAYLVLFARHLPVLRRLSITGAWTCRLQCRALETFIRLHRSHFGALHQIVHWQLPGVQTFRSESGNRATAVTAQDYLAVLKLLDRPVSVDMGSWDQFSRVCLQLDLATWCSRLTAFHHAHGLPHVANTFLQQCRALQHLTILVRHANDFEWATTQEKKTLSAAEPRGPLLPIGSAVETAPAPTATTMRQDHRLVRPTPTGVKLKSATLAVPYFLLARTLCSVAQGFGTDLERWTVTTYSERELRELQAHEEGDDDDDDVVRATTATDQVVLDGCWALPKLRLWHVGQATANVVFGPGIFRRGAFPMLHDLSLAGHVGCLTTTMAVALPAVDGIQAHDDDDGHEIGQQGAPTIPHFETWHLPRLERLQLGDGVAHLFEWTTLQHSPGLRSLELCDRITRIAQEQARVPRLMLSSPSSLSSSPSLAQQQQWSWTMARLTTLHLAGRPALAFRVSWLDRCPALEDLHVEDMTPASYAWEVMEVSETIAATTAAAAVASASASYANRGEEEETPWSQYRASKISTCYLQINTRRPVDALQLWWMMGRYCSNVRRLVLKGSMDHREEWGEMDVGTALVVAKGLRRLERLVVNVGYRPTRVGEYGLVRASTDKGEAITDEDVEHECWPGHVNLSRFVMEVYGMNIRVGVFRQVLGPPPCQHARCGV